MKSESVDVLVIGAGPAGSVAAAIVKKYGLNVKMVEKLKFRRTILTTLEVSFTVNVKHGED